MKIVIVGHGIAGANAAKQVRKLSSKADIMMIGSEPFYCYNRPRLIEVLGGKSDLIDIYYYPPEWYTENHIEPYLNVKAERLFPEIQQVVTDCGQTFYYDKLLLATGSRPRLPGIDGIKTPGVFTIRTIEDVRKIQNWARKCRKSIVIGGGLLGLETAHNLAKLGLKVAVIDRNPWPLSKQIDEQGSKILQEELNEKGITVVSNGNTSRIEEGSGIGDRLKVHLSDQTQLESGMVVVSVGIEPNIELAQNGDLEINKGIVVDEFLRTSEKEVYAAGDVAEFEGKIYGIIPAAMEQGKIAGENMIMGNTHKYRGTVPSTSLKIAGINLVSLGTIYPQPKDDVVIKTDEAKRVYKKAVFRDGNLIGAILLGDKTEFPQLNRMLRSGEKIEAPESVFD